MGYHSSVRGAITITPPLTFAEYEDSPFIHDYNSREWRCFRLVMEFEVDTTATPPQTGGPGMVATELQGLEDEYKCYDAVKDLTEFITTFSTFHTFSGYLIRSGEEQGDLERYTIVDNTVVTEKARLVWSDGPIENIEDVAQEDYQL